MATFSFADLSASMPQLYRELRPQIQRKCPTLAVLAMKQCTTGQNIGWDVTFSGQTAGAVNTDGGSFLTAAADPNVAATLGFAGVAAPVNVKTKAQWTGNAIGAPGYDWLKNLLDRNLMEAVNALCKYINQQIFNGSGSGNQLTGLSTAVSSTGIYANISASTYTGWASTLTGNSNSLRNMTLALIKTMASTISTNSAQGRPDLVVMPGALFNVLEGLFDGTFYTQAGRGDLVMGKVQTNAGLVDARGFRSMVWQSAGLTFIEDPDCLNSAVSNTTSAIYMLNSNSVEMQFLAPANVSQYAPDQKIIAAVEQDMGSLANLQFDFRMRGRTAYADEGDVTAMLNVVVKDRNACGCLYDLQ